MSELLSGPEISAAGLGLHKAEPSSSKQAMPTIQALQTRPEFGRAHLRGNRTHHEFCRFHPDFGSTRPRLGRSRKPFAELARNWVKTGLDLAALATNMPDITPNLADVSPSSMPPEVGDITPILFWWTSLRTRPRTTHPPRSFSNSPQLCSTSPRNQPKSSQEWSSSPHLVGVVLQIWSTPSPKSADVAPPQFGGKRIDFGPCCLREASESATLGSGGPRLVLQVDRTTSHKDNSTRVGTCDALTQGNGCNVHNYLSAHLWSPPSQATFHPHLPWPCWRVGVMRWRVWRKAHRLHSPTKPGGRDQHKHSSHP